MTGEVALVVLAVLLVALAGVWAGMEAAIARISRARAEELEQQGRRGAAALRRVVADAPRYLNLLTLLRVTFELVATVLVTMVCLDVFGARWHAVVVASAVMVIVSYVAVGVGPRTIGRQHAQSVALVGAVVVRPLSRVLGPLPQLLILLGNALTPGRGFREGPFATEAELRDLVDLAQKDRVIADRERLMIHSVFELGDTIVRGVMVPRPDMVVIERSKTLRRAISLALRSGFSRIPVIGDGGIDDIVGIAYLKDFVRRTYEYRDAESAERVESVMRAATFVPESKPVDALLREMQAKQTHIAVVVDEYGGTAGLVTIEDLIEEIVGEIADEYDVGLSGPERLPNGGVRVSSRTNLDEISDLVGIRLEDEDIDSVGGLLAKTLGRVPIPGAQVEVSGVRLTAESTTGRRNRIGTVLVEPLVAAARADEVAVETAGEDGPASRGRAPDGGGGELGPARAGASRDDAG